MKVLIPHHFSHHHRKNNNRGRDKAKRKDNCKGRRKDRFLLIRTITTTRTQAAAGHRQALMLKAAVRTPKAARGGDSGGNTISLSTVVEGDEANRYPASTAVAGIASECVNVMAAQGMDGGFSLGGISAECQATIAATYYFYLATAFQDSDPEKAAEYLEAGHKYAEKAAPGSFQIALKDVSEMATDFLPLVLVGWALGIPTW